MNILCYGVSAERQKERCEFFQGAGCNAEWATDLDVALALLTRKRFDAVVFGQAISVSHCNLIGDVMCSIQPGLTIFSLSELNPEVPSQVTGGEALVDQDQWSSLESVYNQLKSRGASSRA